MSRLLAAALLLAACRSSDEPPPPPQPAHAPEAPEAPEASEAPEALNAYGDELARRHAELVVARKSLAQAVAYLERGRAVLAAARTDAARRAAQTSIDLATKAVEQRQRILDDLESGAIRTAPPADALLPAAPRSSCEPNDPLCGL